ncbi:hypothetical protein [Marilutibacter spongiae]|uniref:Uncharacterized protein n=1 Tax=Marilutibacter spongiae TaxID=2025720 RepID=A0A7W3TL84_9GAMM|nr:hypothetical protein [Lysobacter spongiae]MBB1060410.1 hypothetical protein [Lysobacter spongiae]
MGPGAIIQAVVASAIALLLFFGGRSCGAASVSDDRAELKETLSACDARVDSLETSLTEMVAMYDDANAATEAAEEKAEAWRIRADDEAKLAADGRRRLQAEIHARDEELAEFKKDPTCRAQLEARLCAALY